MGRTDLREILQHINPAELDYQGWLNVGMALKHEGYAVEDWDAWSRQDYGRYHKGECRRKWEGFRGSAAPVTGGTIVQMALDRGWKPEKGHELGWDDTIAQEWKSPAIIDRDWIEARKIAEPGAEWDPKQELITYLETLFADSDTIGYVTHSFEKNGRYILSKGVYNRTAGQLIHDLYKYDDIGYAVGDYKKEAGAWIRFNPLDGKGVTNDNVTEFRFALVESDDMEIEKQNAVIRELELPVACLVHSGGRSLHAVVHVDAANYQEYHKRVDYLYKVCEKNGFVVDPQNKNPSRLSRMPGVLRNGRKQFLVDTNIGKKSWDEWQEWIESVSDDLPDPEGLADVWDRLPELSPCLVEGVLRHGHKMLIAGPSKAGKSFLQIELCIAIAEGKKWLGWQCAKGRVMYVNLELDRASCLHRFKDVYMALGWHPEGLCNIDVWNLRGKSVPMDKLAPKLIRRASKKNYAAVVIDPIYKVITGDENSADQMANFCNQFDKVCTELACAVIYCHHHSKGSQGAKKSMDRASGSGVFARDPDALLDLIELEKTDALMKQEENKAVCAACIRWLDMYSPGWRDETPEDSLPSSVQMLAICSNRLDRQQMAQMEGQIKEIKAAVKTRTAWRVEGTLREFPQFEPVNTWFDYPVHKLDDVGCLKDIQPEAETPPWKQATEKRKKQAEDIRLRKRNEFEIGFSNIELDGREVSAAELADKLGTSSRELLSWLGDGKRQKTELKKYFEKYTGEDGKSYVRRRYT